MLVKGARRPRRSLVHQRGRGPQHRKEERNPQEGLGREAESFLAHSPERRMIWELVIGVTCLTTWKEQWMKSMERARPTRALLNARSCIVPLFVCLFVAIAWPPNLQKLFNMHADHQEAFPHTFPQFQQSLMARNADNWGHKVSLYPTLQVDMLRTDS